MPDAQQAEMKDVLLKAIEAKDAEIDSAETAWEQRQREMPVADVTSGLTGEYTFDDSLSNAFMANAAAKC